MKKLLTVLLLATQTTGCANLLNKIGESQKVGPPSLFSPQLERAIKSTLDCSIEVKATLFDPAPDPIEKTKSEVCGSVNQFAKAVSSSRAHPSDSSNAQSMFKAGANTSDALCFSWFAELDGMRRASRASHDAVSGLGALTNAVQVLTGVEPNGIGIATAAFNQAGLGFDALERNYLLSSEMATIYNSLKVYRERTYRTYLGLDDQEAPDGDQQDASMIGDYYDAERYLLAYHDTCSSNSIQNFIDRSIRRGGSETPTEPEQAEEPEAPDRPTATPPAAQTSE